MTMTPRLLTRTGGLATAMLAVSVNVYAQQPASPTDHAAHHPIPAEAVPEAANQPHTATDALAPGAKLDALVKTMNAATGAAKADAVAELLTAIVADHQSCATKMADKKMADRMADTMKAK
jgi:hypothetical protein